MGIMNRQRGESSAQKKLGFLTGAVVLLSSIMSLTASAYLQVAGDVNCDGVLNVCDLVLLSRYISEDFVSINEKGLENADLDDNGELDSKDLNTQMRLIAKLPIEEEPIAQTTVAEPEKLEFDMVPVCIQYKPGEAIRRPARDDGSIVMEKSHLSRLEWWITNEHERHTVALDVDLTNTNDCITLLNIELDPNKPELSTPHIMNGMTYLPQEVHFSIYGDVIGMDSKQSYLSLVQQDMKLFEGKAEIVLTRTRDDNTIAVTKTVQIRTDLEKAEMDTIITESAAFEKGFGWQQQNTLEYKANRYMIARPKVNLSGEPLEDKPNVEETYLK